MTSCTCCIAWASWLEEISLVAMHDVTARFVKPGIRGYNRVSFGEPHSTQHFSGLFLIIQIMMSDLSFSCESIRWFWILLSSDPFKCCMATSSILSVQILGIGDGRPWTTAIGRALSEIPLSKRFQLLRCNSGPLAWKGSQSSIFCNGTSSFRPYIGLADLSSISMIVVRNSPQGLDLLGRALLG